MIKNKIALRASSTGSIYLDNVKLGPEALLPKSYGLSSVFSCLNNARYELLSQGKLSLFHGSQVRHILGRYGGLGRLPAPHEGLRARAAPVQEATRLVPVRAEETRRCADRGRARLGCKFAGNACFLFLFRLSLPSAL